MSTRVHIAIAEPSVIIRSGLVAVLQKMPSLNIDIAEIPNITSLTDQLALIQPDLLFVNPANMGIFSASQFREAVGNVELKIVALLSTMTDSSILQSYDGSISIYDRVESIKDKLEEVIGNSDTIDTKRELSAREKEIIICVVKGMTNKMIADELCLSTHTVISHRRNISAKLQIHSTSGLTIYAIVNKLVDLTDIKSTISKE